MKTQDQDTLNANMLSPESGAERKGRAWVAYFGAILVVALIAGVSAVVFSQWKAHRVPGQLQGTGQYTNAPPSGQWNQVLSGYTVTELEAVRSNPAVLYACAVQGPLKAGYNLQYTVMRSSDFGSHWQDVGSKAGLSGSCQLAVNPADSNEVYVVSGPASGLASSVLQHSTDGGQTWTTIVPTLRSASLPWTVQQIRLEGHTLFGIQWMFTSAPFQHSELMPDGSFPLGRLVESVDGGHTWTIVDSYFNATMRGVRSYVVDPSDSRTIYEIVGTLWLPVRPQQPQENSIPQIYGINEGLYKTTDGGRTWTLLLNSLRFGSKVQLASSSPNIVYVSSITGPLPEGNAQASSTGRVASSRFLPGNFLLRMSSDGGAHWRNVIQASQLTAILNWFVNSDGQLYAFTSDNAKILRYDPGADTWSTVTQAPTPGTLLATTSAATQHGAVLWVMSTGSGKPTLYRYVA